MKIHAPKFLRSTSKARAWYGLALLLGVGFFLLSSRADAALTSPSPVVTGSQYGKNYNLGLRSPAPSTQMELGWPAEHPENRRMVVAEVNGKPLLVAAFVNDNDKVCTGATCRLEFRVSLDGGKTWANALEGSTPWLPILGPKYDYTLYLDPKEKDIWVSYTYATKKINVDASPVSNPSTEFTRSIIKKLELNTSTNATWLMTGPEEEPLLDGATCNWTFSGNTEDSCVSQTAVAVQTTSSGYRVWSAVAYRGTGREMHYVYTDNFGNHSTWTNAAIFGRTSFTLNTHYGPEARMQAVPIGTRRVPAFFSADPEYWEWSGTECQQADSNSESINIRTPKTEYEAVFLNSGGSTYAMNPKIVPFVIDPEGSNDATCKGFPASPAAALPLGFSIAAFPTSALASRVIIAYEGGTDAVYSKTLGGSIRLKECIITIVANGGVGSTNVSCNPLGEYLLPDGQNHYSPSVTFDSTGTPWIVAREKVSNKIAVFKGTGSCEFSPCTWSWAKTAATPYDTSIVGTTNIPAAVDLLPGSFTALKSGLPAFMWSDLGPTGLGNNRIAFSENMGGSTIGTNPFSISNPILGYGWSPNLGWISTNCANKPDQNCTNPYGLGIGFEAHGEVQTPDKDQLPNIVYGSNVLSPSSVTTFPIGGYAWSPNAGFLSLERRDSICPSTDTNCTTAPATPNPNGNPPGLAYNNYNPGGAANQNVPLAKYDTANQHVYGWGRFLSLCDYDSVNARCKNKDAGWVRLRGYYTGFVAPVSVNFTSSSQFTVANSSSNCISDTWGFAVGEVLLVSDEYLVVKTCSDSPDGFGNYTLTVTLEAPLQAANAYPKTLVVENISDNAYGVDAYWTGDHYELAGWAWSSDYGWIRFDPLIFLGYAWLETLFGNVYSGGNIQLPNATDLLDVRFSTCGESGAEPCYVSTYRIEAGGTVQALTRDGSVLPLDSYTRSIIKKDAISGEPAPGTTSCNPADTATYNEAYCLLRGDAGEVSALQQLVTRGGLLPKLDFPTVGNTTVSYRNALGKLDVGGLTTLLGNPQKYPQPSTTSRYFTTEKNRFGQTVYKTPFQENWTINELSGWVNNPAWPSTVSPIFPLNVTTVERDEVDAKKIAPLRSQVIHVQGNVTVDGNEATYSSNNAGNFATGTATITVSGISAPQTFPTQAVVGNKTVACSGCAFVIDQGKDTEEYFSYTSYNPTTRVFSGVRRIGKCAGTSMCKLHSGGTSKVRWAWRLPYANNGTTDIAQRTTIVIDGNLDIQYNIIAADYAKDADLSAIAAPNNIRDLPTIAFVVKGNVTVNPAVNKLTGAYIVSSKDTAEAAGGANGGKFSTGDDHQDPLCDVSTKKCNPLTINGLLFARVFDFQRIGYLDKADKSAEKIIADERLFLNPPPGLEDVTKALPNPQRTLP